MRTVTWQFKRAPRKPPAVAQPDDPFEMINKPRTICVMCRYVLQVLGPHFCVKALAAVDPVTGEPFFSAFVKVLFCAKDAAVDPVTGEPFFRTCRSVNRGDCPKYEEEPPAPTDEGTVMPLDPPPPPPTFWRRIAQRAKEFLWA